MKKNYYKLQAYVYEKGYVTIFTYSGTRSNANRKFRSFLDSNPIVCQSSVLRVLTYSSLNSMLAGRPFLRSLPFYL